MLLNEGFFELNEKHKTVLLLLALVGTSLPFVSFFLTLYYYFQVACDSPPTDILNSTVLTYSNC